MVPWQTLTRVAVVVAVVVSLAVANRLDSRDWGALLRGRFLAGVPWGTLLTVGGLLFVYLVVQGGLAHWYRPLVLPFRAWSYLYPLGMVLAPFAHAGPAHLVGNLIGTLALAPLAEYAWGHYPTERGSRTFSSLRTNPYARVLAVPAAAVVAGLFTSLFAIGPVIGFSGVVFAFAGVALVRYPLSTVIAVSAGGVLRLVYSALRNPVVEAGADPSFGSPWWAGIAIQTHAIGLLFGVLVGVALVRRRDVRPPVGRLWLGTLLFGVGQSLWAVYWFRGNGQFVLYRALGAVLVFGLALLVAASVAPSGRVSLPRLSTSVGRRTVSVGAIALALVVLAAPAIPVNLTTVETTDEVVFAAGGGTGLRAGTDASLVVREYTVIYAENVTNQKVSVFNISVFGETTQVKTSGVIVKNERRHIWVTAIRTGELAFDGWESVKLGGLGWSATVAANRNGWRTAGGGHVYKVYLNGPGDGRQLAYRSEPATAGPTIRGKNITLTARANGFGIVVTRHNRTLGRAPLPNNGTVHVAGLTFSREGRRLFVIAGRTRVQIAKEEKYH